MSVLDNVLKSLIKMNVHIRLKVAATETLAVQRSMIMSEAIWESVNLPMAFWWMQIAREDTAEEW